MSGTRVFDERADRPLRTIIGDLLARSHTADIALSRVRLASLDLSDTEIQGPHQCRVLLGQLDASVLLDAARDGHPHPKRLHRLQRWLATDRLEVRSAGIGAWVPDFSIYRSTSPQAALRGAGGPNGGATCIIGAHYFGTPQMAVGPSVTVITNDHGAVDLLSRRFGEVWDRAHDVAPAIRDVLERATAGGAGGRVAT